MSTRSRVLAGAGVVALAVVLAAGVGAAVGVLHGWGPRPVGSAGPPSTLPSGRSTDATRCPARPDNWNRSWHRAVFSVSVDADPRSVTAVWWPTWNDQNCQVVSTTGDQGVATSLARDIRKAPPITSGVRHCPMIVGGAVDLYFAYGGGRWQRVRVYPTGCAEITAPNRRPRQSLLAPDLAPVAPPGEWQRVLR